jgi:hypothetical protein
VHREYPLLIAWCWGAGLRSCIRSSTRAAASLRRGHDRDRAWRPAGASGL